MNLLFLSPALLAITFSGSSLLNTVEVGTPESEPAPVPTAVQPDVTDPRASLAEEIRRLEALRAELKAAEREAELAKQRAAVVEAATPMAAAPARVAQVPAVRPGPRATLLATVRLQPASGLSSAARGLTPESDWRAIFPKKDGR